MNVLFLVYVEFVSFVFMSWIYSLTGARGSVVG
jgi:hypothetical protein